jgi:hypothetical protein
MLSIDSFIKLLPKVKNNIDISSYISRLIDLSDNLNEILDELGNIINALKSKSNIDIPDEARRIERSKKKKIMGGVGVLVIIAIIVGAVAIYMFYIRDSRNEEYIPENVGKADEGNRRYLDNKPTFTANDRAVLDLITDLNQVSKEVNQK